MPGGTRPVRTDSTHLLGKRASEPVETARGGDGAAGGGGRFAGGWPLPMFGSASRVGHRRRFRERPSIGMERRPEDVVVGAGLNDEAQVHHVYDVGNVSDRREIVADEYVRQGEFVLQSYEKIDDLRQ